MGPARALWFQKRSSCGRRTAFVVHTRVLNLSALLRKHRAGLFASCSSRFLLVLRSVGHFGRLGTASSQCPGVCGNAQQLSCTGSSARQVSSPVSGNSAVLSAPVETRDRDCTPVTLDWHRSLSFYYYYFGLVISVAVARVPLGGVWNIFFCSLYR
ncbi:unnamed protein product [Ixodes pacificus]